MANRHLREHRHLHGLLDRNLDGPTPENHPELLVRELHVGKPGVGQKGEANPALPASVPPIRDVDMIAFTYRAIHVLAEYNPTKACPDLGLRGNLFELVHIHDDTPFARICANSL